MFKLKGGCHCKNILVDIEFSRPPDSFPPRACDCDFCLKHAAAYVSDPNGSLNFHVKDTQLLGKYRQGSGTADFLFCKSCGVLIGVTYQNSGQTYAAANSRVVEGARFGEKVDVSPKTLGVNEKTKRWQEVWFSKVIIES